MKKVLFILHYPPPVHGAAQIGRYIRESELVNKTFDCRYVNLGISLAVADIGKGAWFKMWRTLVLVKSILWNLISFKPDLVYMTFTTSGRGFYKDALIAMMIKLFDFKLIYHLHNKGVSLYQNRKLDNFLYKIAFENVSVILLSKLLYSDVAKYVSENNVFYCANGIPDFGVCATDSKHTFKAKRVQILFLSNLVVSKGVYDLLGACQILQKKNLLFECIFVGGEGDIGGNQLQHEIESLKLGLNVRYVGGKFGDEKRSAYSLADIFVLPTSKECFPLVLLEAMQFALPVVTTIEGGIPDIVEENVTGLLVPAKDTKALANALEKLVRNPTMRSRFGENGRRRFELNFKIKSFESRFVKIINECLNE